MTHCHRVPLLLDTEAPAAGVVQGVHVCPPEMEGAYRAELESNGGRVVSASYLERKRLEKHFGRPVRAYSPDGPGVA